jgi:hypothetical protein
MFPFAQFVGKLCRIRLPDGATNTLHAPDFDASALNLKFALTRPQTRLRTSGSKGH